MWPQRNSVTLTRERVIGPSAEQEALVGLSAEKEQIEVINVRRGRRPDHGLPASQSARSRDVRPEAVRSAG